MGLHCPAKLAGKKTPAASPRSRWESMGEVFSLSQASLIVYFMACFLFESKLEAKIISIEELMLVFIVLVACLFLWCRQQSAGSKIHQKKLHAHNASAIRSFTITCATRFRVRANLLLAYLFGTRQYNSCTYVAPSTEAASTTRQAPKDEEHDFDDMKTTEVQTEQDQQQLRTFEPLTCASNQQLSQAFQAWRLQLREFQITSSSQVDSCSVESVTQSESLLITEEQDNSVTSVNESVTELPPTQTQSESLPLKEEEHSVIMAIEPPTQISPTQEQSEFLLHTNMVCKSETFTKELPAYVTLQHSHWVVPIFARELPAYVTTHESRLFGPQAPIDKVPSLPAQHDEKILPGSKAIIGSIQDTAQQIHRSGPQFLLDKIPSSPLQHDEKVLSGSRTILGDVLNTSKQTHQLGAHSLNDKMPTSPHLRENKQVSNISRTKAWRLVNCTRTSGSRSSTSA